MDRGLGNLHCRIQQLTTAAVPVTMMMIIPVFRCRTAHCWINKIPLLSQRPHPIMNELFPRLKGFNNSCSIIHSLSFFTTATTTTTMPVDGNFGARGSAVSFMQCGCCGKKIPGHGSNCPPGRPFRRLSYCSWWYTSIPLSL